MQMTVEIWQSFDDHITLASTLAVISVQVAMGEKQGFTGDVKWKVTGADKTAVPRL